MIIEGKTWALLELVIKQLQSGFSDLSQVSEKGWFTEGKTLREILVHAHAGIYDVYIPAHTVLFELYHYELIQTKRVINVHPIIFDSALPRVIKA